MNNKTPILLWFRRDFRLTDHPALCAAVASGQPVIAVFIHDETVAALGAAPKMRMGRAVKAFADRLATMGSRLILRRGPALAVLQDLIAETGARDVYWSRLYDSAAKVRDTNVKAALKNAGINAQSFGGHVLFEPWTVATQTGGFYRVYTPMWKAVRDRDVGPVLAAPETLMPPLNWPRSDEIDDWKMDAAMNRGADILARHVCVGEVAAMDRLDQFFTEKVVHYKEARDNPGVDGTSRLSENLSYGEISARQCWYAGWRALHDGAGQAEVFLKELVWREFAYHLVHHSPEIESRNWKPDWDGFAWQAAESDEVQAWKQGRTGIRFVDAAMREMYVTGTMHNRGRMNVASYLTKHLLTDWRVGQAWFAECLIDWDPASNAMGWQWAAGSGPDAAPYFRIFNPDTQLEKFDTKGLYGRRWIAEGEQQPSETALSYFDAVPRRWRLDPTASYPKPVVGLSEGRERALKAYENRGF